MSTAKTEKEKETKRPQRRKCVEKSLRTSFFSLGEDLDALMQSAADVMPLSRRTGALMDVLNSPDSPFAKFGLPPIPEIPKPSFADHITTLRGLADTLEFLESPVSNWASALSLPPQAAKDFGITTVYDLIVVGHDELLKFNLVDELLSYRFSKILEAKGIDVALYI